MPIKETPYKSQLSGTVDDFLRSKRQKIQQESGRDEADVDFMSIIDFVERFRLLPNGLFPVQKFILKLYYNEPLEAVEKTIKVTDKFGIAVRFELTEVEYLKYLFDNGRCNLKVQDAKERKELILVVGRRSGKCVAEGTRILTDKGVFNIEELGDPNGPEDQPSNIGVALEGTQTRSRCSNFFNNGDAHVYRLRTAFGYEISPTTKHRLKVLTEHGNIEWKFVGDVGEGDFIGIHRRTDLWASDLVPIHDLSHGQYDSDFLDEKLARFLGSLVGIETRDPDADHGSVDPALYDLVRAYRDGDSAARQFIQNLGWQYFENAPDRRVPWSILRSPKSVVGSFFQGLVPFGKFDSPERNSIYFRFQSKELARDLQVLLTNFGIVARVSYEYDREYDRREYKLAFSLSPIGTIECDYVPYQHEWLRLTSSFLPDFGDPALVARAQDILDSTIDGRNISYTGLRDLVSILHESGLGVKHKGFPEILTHFTKLLDTDYFWDPVQSISVDLARVYDLHVPDVHEYVAEAMTNHNSEMASIIAAYELYKLLARGNPQSFYGMPSGSDIRLLCVATDKEQASIVHGNMQGHVESVDYFKTSIANRTQTFLKFRTEHDREKFGKDGKSSITATFRSSIAKGLRGRGVICVVLDEIAHFVNDGFSSAENVYKAIYPSLAQFSPKDPKNKHIPLGPSDGRMIMISSPDNREGFFYKQFQRAMSGDKGGSNSLVIQAPTWEVNPTLSRDYYEVEYYKDPRAFMSEHGAEFTDRVRGWIENSHDLLECVDLNLRPRTAGIPREIYFAGVDFGIINDGTSIALTRFNQGKIELAYHEIWYASKGWKESNPHLESPMSAYADTLHLVKRIDVEEIADWFSALSKRFYIIKGIFDPWAGPVIEQILHKKGLKQFNMRNFTASESSQMFQTFKMMLFNHQLSLYDYPPPRGTDDKLVHSPLISELLELQMTNVSKNVFTVEAPDVFGKHDDMSDALARSVLLAAEYLSGHPEALHTRAETVQRHASVGVGYNQYHRNRTRMHGVIKERHLPRRLR